MMADALAEQLRWSVSCVLYTLDPHDDCLHAEDRQSMMRTAANMLAGRRERARGLDQWSMPKSHKGPASRLASTHREAQVCARPACGGGFCRRLHRCPPRREDGLHRRHAPLQKRRRLRPVGLQLRHCSCLRLHRAQKLMSDFAEQAGRQGYGTGLSLLLPTHKSTEVCIIFCGVTDLRGQRTPLDFCATRSRSRLTRFAAACAISAAASSSDAASSCAAGHHADGVHASSAVPCCGGRCEKHNTRGAVILGVRQAVMTRGVTGINTYFGQVRISCGALR